MRVQSFVKLYFLWPLSVVICPMSKVTEVTLRSGRAHAKEQFDLKGCVPDLLISQFTTHPNPEASEAADSTVLFQHLAVFSEQQEVKPHPFLFESPKIHV